MRLQTQFFALISQAYSVSRKWLTGFILYRYMVLVGLSCVVICSGLAHPMESDPWG